MSRPWTGGRPQGWQQGRRPSRLRGLIAAEAARLMVEEEVKHYFDAKRMASKALLGAQGARSLRFRPRDLPGNGEIREQILLRSQLCLGAEQRTRLLYCMRLLALEVMEELSPLRPRLIGSVSTGHVRRGSDIDLHIFCDELDEVLDQVEELGWPWDTEEVLVRKGGDPRLYHHVFLHLAYRVELSIYPLAELRERPRSSTDGRPIDRLSPARLRALLEEEHGEDYARYLDGEPVPELEGAEEELLEAWAEEQGEE
jgi:hypothetical protein